MLLFNRSSFVDEYFPEPVGVQKSKTSMLYTSKIDKKIDMTKIISIGATDRCTAKTVLEEFDGTE